MQDLAIPPACGLVPSINNVKTSGQLVADHCLTIDHLQSRCTRLRKNLGIVAKRLSLDAPVTFMLTLTYRDAVDWSPSHIRDAIRHLRQWVRRKHGEQLRYVWVMENKPRQTGARIGQYIPHYHLIVWTSGAVRKDDLHLDLQGWWPHGMTNVVKAVAPVKYVMKYASKFENGNHFPKGARVYGIGGLDDVGRRCRRWVNWPSFVQARASVSCAWRRASGGGWVDANGECWPSEFALAAVGKGYTRIVRARSYPVPPVPPSGPFSWVSAFAGAAEKSFFAPA